MAWFGNQTTGSSGGNAENFIWMGRFQSTQAGTLDSISIRVRTNTLTAKKLNGAIYADDGGEGDLNVALIAQAAEQTVGVGTTDTWITCTFASPPSVTNGTWYRLAFRGAGGSGVFTCSYTSSIDGEYASYISSAYGNFPNPSGDMTAADNYRLDIYATYTDSPAGWSHQIYGVTPASIMGVAVANITSVNGIE